MKSRNKKRDLTSLGLAVIILILLNFVGSFMFHRFDLTAEKRYTLSDATKKILSELKDVVYVKVYLEGEFPAGFKRLRNETREMLDEFRAYSNGNIEYQFIDPLGDPDKAQQNKLGKQLENKGLQPISLEVKEENGTTQQIIWPAAIVSFAKREAVWNLLKTQAGQSAEAQLNNSIESLEYEFASCINKLTTPIRPVVGFVEGHGELDTLATGDIREALSEFYHIKRVKMNGQLNALDGLKAIVIAKPDSAFSEHDLFLIDQFIVKGGKVLWALDVLNTDKDTLIRYGETMAEPINLRLESMLYRYGARVNSNLLIDLQCSGIPVNTALRGQQPKYDLKPWIFFPLLTPNNAHPIVKNLDVIKSEYASSIDTIDVRGIQKTVLLRSSKFTKTLVSPVRIDLRYMRLPPDETKFTDGNQAVALLLEGSFESVFKNHPSRNKLKSLGIGYTEEGKHTQQIIIADGDIIRNDIQYSTRKPHPLGYDIYTGQVFGNKNFILNCMNYLCDDSGLISIRSREITLRLLDKKKAKAEKLKWQIINTVGPLSLIFLFGVIYFIRRKRKYAS